MNVSMPVVAITYQISAFATVWILKDETDIALVAGRERP
jgi:hypothetical protein